MPIVTFHLKEDKTILQKIKRPVLDMQIKTLYRNKSSKTKPFEFSPLSAVFKLPADYKKRNLRIVVFSPEGKAIYSAPVQKKQEIKPKKYKYNKIDKTYQKGG